MTEKLLIRTFNFKTNNKQQVTYLFKQAVFLIKMLMLVYQFTVPQACLKMNSGWFESLLISKTYEPHHKKTGLFAYMKTKTQISSFSCAVTAQLISTFVFASWIIRTYMASSSRIHGLFFSNP